FRPRRGLPDASRCRMSASRPTASFFRRIGGGRGSKSLPLAAAPFSPVKLQAPTRMQLEKRYWFVEVTARAQSIDWDRSETKQHAFSAPDGRAWRTLNETIFSPKPSVKFKAMTADIPPIWREAELDRDDAKYFFPRRDILMRDELWAALNARFPGQ